jgi:hypothetical protein
VTVEVPVVAAVRLALHTPFVTFSSANVMLDPLTLDVIPEIVRAFPSAKGLALYEYGSTEPLS